MSDIVERLREVFADSKEVAESVRKLDPYWGPEAYAHILGQTEAMLSAADEIERLRREAVSTHTT